MRQIEDPRLLRAIRGHIGALRELAQAERDAGDLDSARAHALQALRLAEQHELEDQTATMLHVLGKISCAQGEEERAVKEFSRALTAAAASQSLLLAAFCCEEIASIASQQGDEELAEVMLAGAEDAFWSVPDLDDEPVEETGSLAALLSRAS